MILVYGLVLLLPLVLAGSSCPEGVSFLPCHCSRTSGLTKIYCKKATTEADILSVAKTISDERLIIDLVFINSDYLTSIGSNFFGQASVLYASFQSGNLTTVNQNAFKGQEHTMEVLEFHKTSITVPPSVPLTGLRRLTTYAVYSNSHITTIDKQFYDSVSKDNGIIRLDLSGNVIKTVDLNIKDFFPKLQFLFLEANQLTQAPKITLSDASRVKVINLSQNKLGDIPSNLVKTMPQGSTLNLRHNSVGNIYEDDVITSINRLVRINLMDNPIGCGCNMRWLYNYTSSSKFHISGRCVSPVQMKSKFLSKIRKSSFHWCDKTY